MRKSRRDLEQKFQKAVAQFLDCALPDDAVWTAINPVPGKTKAIAGLSKAMGLKAGIPDIYILWRCQAHHLELKLEDGEVEADQVDMIRRLSAAGAKCGVAYTLEAVISLLNEWGIPLKARLVA